MFVSLMTLKNLVFGISAPRLVLGICSRRAVDLNLYGNGGFCVITYATTLLHGNHEYRSGGGFLYAYLGCTTYVSPALSFI